MSADITITPKYKLTSDALQWIIKVRKGNNSDGTERWEARSYYVTPLHALKGLQSILLRDADTKTLEDLENAANSIASMLEGSMDRIAIAHEFRKAKLKAVL